MYPRDAMLGRVAGRDGFFKLHRVTDAHSLPGLRDLPRPGSLLFFNTDYVHSRIVGIADSLPAGTRWFIMDASAIAQIDSSATAMLEDVRVELSKRGISLGIAELHAEAREMLRRAGVLDRIGPEIIFDSLEDAQVAFIKTTPGSKEISYG